MLELRLIRQPAGVINPNTPHIDLGSLVERQSRRHPTHEFKIGYFFSKSNPEGFNRVIKAISGEDIYSILGFTTSTPDFFKPEWRAITGKVATIRSKLDSHLRDCGGYHNVHSIPRRDANQPKTEQEALEYFRTEMRRSRGWDYALGNFTSEKGDFLLSSPFKVAAIIPADPSNHTLCYIIVEEDLTWYLDALDIIEETVDFVLSQSDREVFSFCWSA